MTRKQKGQFIPVDRHETIRRDIISVIEGKELSAKDISGIVGIPEKAVYDHIAHIRISLHKKGLRLKIIPAECKHCGFSFKKREKLQKPGKCPICRAEKISEPLFSIEVKR